VRDLFRLKILRQREKSLLFLGSYLILDSHIRVTKPLRDFKIENLLPADGMERQWYLIYLHDDDSDTILSTLGHGLDIFFGEDTEILTSICVVFQVKKEDCDKTKMYSWE
jgi:hypothetical protein